MPTNRTRQRRSARSHVPAIITPGYLQRLKLRDFMGTLTEEEIPIAKKHGVYRFDAYIKERNAQRRQHTEP